MSKLLSNEELRKLLIKYAQDSVILDESEGVHLDNLVSIINAQKRLHAENEQAFAKLTAMKDSDKSSIKATINPATEYGQAELLTEDDYAYDDTTNNWLRESRTMTFEDKLDKILLSHGAEKGELRYSLKKAIKELVLNDVVGNNALIGESTNSNEAMWFAGRNSLRIEQRLIINGKENDNE